MTDFSTLSYTTTSKLATLSYPEAWKRYPIRADPLRIGHYREYPPSPRSQNWQKATWMPKRSLYTCMTSCMNHEPTGWCFARLTINSVSICLSGKILETNGASEKAFGYFPVGKFQAEIWISCLQTHFRILVSGFRGRFSLNKTDLGEW